MVLVWLSGPQKKKSSPRGISRNRRLKEQDPHQRTIKCRIKSFLKEVVENLQNH